MLLAYIYGNKSLIRARALYLDNFKSASKKVFGNNSKILLSRDSDKLHIMFNIKVDGEDYKVELNLVERRTYAYYFAKMFGGIPDAVFLKCDLSKKPSAILYLVSRKRKKLIEKSSKYIYVLDEVNLGSLNRDILALSDAPRYAIKYFNKDVLSDLRNILKDLNYIVVDTASPNLEISLQISENNVKAAYMALKTIKDLRESVEKVRGKGKETDVMSYVRKILRTEKN